MKGIGLCLLFICECFLQAQVLQPLGNGVPGKVVASYASGNDYLALYEDKASSQDEDYSLAKWNGLYWEYFPGLNTPLEVQAANSEYNFNSIAIYNGEIYIGAYISNAIQDLPNPVNHLYKWNGNNWQSVAGAVSSTNYGIYDMTVWNGKLIVAGKFLDTLSGNPVDNIAAYDGTDWIQLGSNNNNQGTNGSIRALFPAGNRLYVAGDFNKFGGTSTGNIAFYTDNNGNWGGVGSPFLNRVVDLALVGNTLWAMDETPLTLERSIRSFESSKWSEPLKFLGYSKAIPTTIAGSKNELFIGGDFVINQKVHSIAVVKDNWPEPTDNRISGTFSLDQKKNDAYIWGDFVEESTDIKYFSPIVSSAGNAAGIVFNDVNGNGKRELGEMSLSNVTLIFTDASGNQHLAYTNENGRYSLSLKPGEYTRSIKAGKHWADGIYGNKTYIKAGEYIMSDFGLRISSVITDATVKIRFNTINKVSPGDREHVSIQVYNSGARTINGSIVEVTHDNQLANFSSEPAASNYSGNKASYTILDLKPRETMIIDAFMTVPADAKQSSRYPVSVSLGSLLNQNDVDKTDNTDEVLTGLTQGENGNVIKKVVTGDTASVRDDVICYNIQCANATGGAVKRVVFTDTLDQDFQLTDANLTYISHPGVKRWSVGRVLVIEIPEANLADREAIPSQSTAAFEFDIVLAKNNKGNVLMPHGTVLTNMATVDFDNKNHIYHSNMTKVLVFDQNAVRRETLKVADIHVYPNPSKEKVYIESKSGQILGRLELYKLNGQRVLQSQANASNAELNIGHLPSNSYLLKSNIGTQIIQIRH